MAWPSVLSSFTDPNPNDNLGTTPHSSIEGDQNAAITALETFIGTDASAVGTLVNDIRAASSDGGGHVQSANKGGTGQTSFNKGDLLVGQSSSVLSKLTAGLDGQILTADSSVASGAKWATTQTNLVETSASIVTLTNSTAETSLMSVSVPGSVLGSTNAVRAKLLIRNIGTDNVDDTVTLRALYGTTSIATLLIGSVIGGANAGLAGNLTFDLIANLAASAQRGQLQAQLSRGVFPHSSVVGEDKTLFGTSAENSDGAKVIGITAQWNDANPSNTLNTNGYTVEKIT